MIVKSKDIYSPANYCLDFYGSRPYFKGEKNELQDYLKSRNIKFKSFPLEKIHQVVAYDLPVVLVDVNYINKNGETCHEYRWFTIPDGGKSNE